MLSEVVPMLFGAREDKVAELRAQTLLKARMRLGEIPETPIPPQQKTLAVPKLAASAPMLFGACKDEVLTRQFPAADTEPERSVGSSSSPPKRLVCDFASSRLDEIPETPNPPQQTLAAVGLSRLHSSPGENPLPVARLLTSPSLHSSHAESTQFSAADPLAVQTQPVSPAAAVATQPDSRAAAPSGASFGTDTAPAEGRAGTTMASSGESRPVAHGEDGGVGAGAGGATEAGGGEEGGGGAEAIQTSERILPKGILRGCSRVRAREGEGGEGAGEAEQGRGGKKRRVGFSDVCEEHVVPLEARRNEDNVLDIGKIESYKRKAAANHRNSGRGNVIYALAEEEEEEGGGGVGVKEEEGGHGGASVKDELRASAKLAKQAKETAKEQAREDAVEAAPRIQRELLTAVGEFVTHGLEYAEGERVWVRPSS
ncbi:hypothetical protein T484DRAFT_3646430 [Baffinella frigidus]|nr:hypothetical protein T484DRAFT_3646430 [Cryptophyta sp. CCMP2293]